MQGVVKSYDPGTGTGTVVRDTDLSEYDLASDALVGSVFRMLRQGQRVVFDTDDAGRAAGFERRFQSEHHGPVTQRISFGRLGRSPSIATPP